MKSIKGLAYIGEDGTLEMELHSDHSIKQGEYEIRILFRERPHFISASDYDVLSLLQNSETIDWSEHTVILRSEGQATIREGRLIYRLPFGTQPGNYSVDIEIYDSLAEMIEHPLPVLDLGPRPEGLSMRREDMYGDDGR